MDKKEDKLESMDLDLEEISEILELEDVVELGPDYQGQEGAVSQMAPKETEEPLFQLEEERPVIGGLELGVEDTQKEPPIETPSTEFEEAKVEEIPGALRADREFPAPSEELAFEPAMAQKTSLFDQDAFQEMVRESIERAVEKAAREVMLEVAERLIGKAIESLKSALKETS
ncbi:MAG: hypothetical protein ACK4WB_06910 [Desulfatiglandales bacterium]